MQLQAVNQGNLRKRIVRGAKLGGAVVLTGVGAWSTNKAMERQMAYGQELITQYGDMAYYAGAKTMPADQFGYTLMAAASVMSAVYLTCNVCGCEFNDTHED